MDTTPVTPTATADLVEHIAAAHHSIVRSWQFDPAAPVTETDGDAAAPPRLTPWLEPTADPHWLHARRPLVDLANTWWEDLPADWRQKFRAVAATAADAIVSQTASGRGAAALESDRAFITSTAARLDCAWLRADRVHPLVRGAEVDGARETLVRAAVRTYAGWLAGERPLGALPSLPATPTVAALAAPPADDLPGDAKRVAFRLVGKRCDPHRLTKLTGLRPERAQRQGQLNISPKTGVLYGPYDLGMWSVSSDAFLDEVEPTLEHHLIALLDRLEPFGPELRDIILEDDLTVDFFCGYFQTQWNASWEISGHTLSRIVRLGASLGYDSYGPDDLVDPRVGEDPESGSV